MKRGFVIALCFLGAGLTYGLTLHTSNVRPSKDKNLVRILPQLDRLEENSAVLWIKTKLFNVSVRGDVIGVPRRVRDGYVVFVPQGTRQLTLNAPLYATQKITFDPLQGGKFYEMTLTGETDKKALKEAALRADRLNLKNTKVSLKVYFDYRDLPPTATGEGKPNALIYLDKRLNFDQWQQLLMPNGHYVPFDVSGNDENPCCLLVKDGELLEEVFRMNKAEVDSYVEKFDGGNTYHTLLELTPKP